MSLCILNALKQMKRIRTVVRLLQVRLKRQVSDEASKVHSHNINDDDDDDDA